MKDGPYVMFGDGELTACKPIGEVDLANFIIECLNDPAKENQTLPIGKSPWDLSTCILNLSMFRRGRTNIAFSQVKIIVALFGCLCALKLTQSPCLFS